MAWEEIQPSLRWFPGERQTPVMAQTIEASQGQTKTTPRTTGTQAPAFDFVLASVLGAASGADGLSRFCRLLGWDELMDSVSVLT